MKSIDFEQSNHVLHGPPGSEADITPLVVYTDGRSISVSCWEPDAEELAAIIKEKKVWLIVMGNIHPPVAVQGTCPIQEVRQN